MSICGGCPYPYEAVLSAECEREEDACQGDCSFQDAIYRAQWAYNRIAERYDTLEKEYKHIKTLNKTMKERLTCLEDDGK